MAEYVPSPSYPNYSAFLTTLGQNLGENLSRQEPRQIAIDRQRLALQQDQMQAAQQKAIQDAFRGGAPMINGAYDYGAMAKGLFQGGDISDAVKVMNLAQTQQQQQAYSKLPPLAPPAVPFTGPPASAATGASTKAPGATGGTISELVSSALPATPVAASVAANFAKAVKAADPNAPLTDAQAAQARKLLDAYAKRQGVKQSAQSGALPTFATGGADAMISHFEGFRPTPYWDVNHWRVGYGSDTITKPDGSVETVTKSTQVSPEDAKRDLQRRIGESQSAISSKIGADNWNRLTPGAQSALTSVAYNYGSVPAKVLAAAKTGDPQRIASAIAALPARGTRRKVLCINDSLEN